MKIVVKLRVHRGKNSYDVKQLVELLSLMRVFARRYPISFWNDRAISAGGRGFCPIFATKLVAMATSLKISGKEGRIDHLPFNTYHTVQRL